MWAKPWKMGEGVAICVALVVVGIMFQLTIGPVDWNVFAFPANSITILVILLLSIVIYALNEKVYFFKYLHSLYAAIPSLLFCVGATVVMGLTRQVPSGAEDSAGLFGFRYMLSSWPFVLLYVFMALILAQAVIFELLNWSNRRIPVLIFHLGFLCVLMFGTLGSADMVRGKVQVGMDTPEWRATDDGGSVMELPLAFQLVDFDIEEYRPKLAQAGANSGRFLPEGKPVTIMLDEDFTSGEIGGWTVEMEKYLDLAAPRRIDSLTRVWEAWNEDGAATAAFLKATKNGVSREGWVSAGSYLFDPEYLPLDDSVTLVMPDRDPQKYVAKVQVLTESGKNDVAEISVNHPYQVDGWQVYLLDFDTAMGKWSRTCVLDVVRDPWLSSVYLGIGMMLLGAVIFLFQRPKKEKEEDEI